ncbi:hypothetical protein [Halobacterium litoreum]|uniref:LEA14-like dessication related protein n=1 Tax=Halobacterium litoreum TaxID=2039234 RepID=A0ABD5NBP0_9EURY|nr:hypothetical protein [Halobacterium litoreum]UHH14773.1 hypothetical protein LT972_07155 [Halobacterium litoreum]
MRRRRVLQTVGASGAALFSGCGSTPLGSLNSKPPLGKLDVSFTDVRKPDFGVTSLTMPLILEFHNPAGQAIPDISGDFDLQVNGERIATDELTINKLEPGERTPHQVDVLVKYGNTTDAVLNLLQEGAFAATLDMELNAGGASRSLVVSTSND